MIELLLLKKYICMKLLFIVFFLSYLFSSWFRFEWDETRKVQDPRNKEKLKTKNLINYSRSLCVFQLFAILMCNFQISSVLRIS